MLKDHLDRGGKSGLRRRSELAEPRSDDFPATSLARSAAGRLEQLDQIAGGILEQDLRTAGPGHDLVAEFDSGGAQPCDLGGEIIDDQVNAVPAAGTGPLAVRIGRPAELLGPLSSRRSDPSV